MDPEAYKSMTTFQGQLPPDLPPDADDWTADGPDVFAKHNTNNPNYKRWMTAMHERGVHWMDNRNPQPFMSMSMSMGMDLDAGVGGEEGEGEGGEKGEKAGPSTTTNPSNPNTQNQKSSNQNFFPHPGLSLPVPELKYDFRLAATLNPLIPVGGVSTSSGGQQRNWISISGGTWSGSWGSGIIVPGGQDSQLINLPSPQNPTPPVSSVPSIHNPASASPSPSNSNSTAGYATLSATYLLRTNDSPNPAHIIVTSRGFRTGPPDVLAALQDPERASAVDPRRYKFRVVVTMETGDERYRDKLNWGMWIGCGMRARGEVVYDAYRVQ